jgi:hypothetical protein
MPVAPQSASPPGKLGMWADHISRNVFVFTSPNKHIARVQISANDGRTWTTMIETTAVKVVS